MGKLLNIIKNLDQFHLLENGDMLQYFSDRYKFKKKMREKYLAGEVTEEEVIEAIHQKVDEVNEKFDSNAPKSADISYLKSLIFDGKYGLYEKNVEESSDSILKKFILEKYMRPRKLNIGRHVLTQLGDNIFTTKEEDTYEDDMKKLKDLEDEKAKREAKAAKRRATNSAYYQKMKADKKAKANKDLQADNAALKKRRDDHNAVVDKNLKRDTKIKLDMPKEPKVKRLISSKIRDIF